MSQNSNISINGKSCGCACREFSHNFREILSDKALTRVQLVSEKQRWSEEVDLRVIAMIRTMIRNQIVR